MSGIYREGTMSKIIENFLVPLFVVISILYAFHSFGYPETATHSIMLNKVYHHITPDEGYLEKANIVLYFSGDPQIKEIKNQLNRSHHQTSFVFFFPQATINQAECQSMINTLNNYKANYRVTIAQATHQKSGVEIRFDFDSQKYLINCEHFDSIGLQKGFVFRLYNKEILTKLEESKNQPVLRTLHNSEKRRIIIDPGHGGRDTGAIGYYGIQEKNVSLAIGTVVGNLLEQHGCSVMFTRNNDKDMQLDERTSYANNNNADLFVSIHANYAHNAKAVGVETFCMPYQLLHRKSSHLSEMQDRCVADVMKQRESMAYHYAQSIQQKVCAYASPFHKESIDRKVKHSVSQVLLGVQFPAILIEVGFLSHHKESQLLNDPQYQRCLARGICDGILAGFSL